MDYTTMTTAEVSQILADAYAELGRRDTISRAPARIEQARQEYVTAIGRADGDEFVQPTGYHDAYPQGATVTHQGKTWESLTPNNVWTPGVSGWRENVADGYPAWVQPLGAHDSYPLGG